jgi:hypothetical protein
MLERIRSATGGRIFGLAPLDLIGLLVLAGAIIYVIPRVADRGARPKIRPPVADRMRSSISALV